MHLGDIGTSGAAQACGDAWVLERKRQFARIRHPFVLIPGDNEWSDCKDPIERLAFWRSLFCASSLQIEKQDAEFCEHMRWEAEGLVFVTLNVPGPDNHVGHAAQREGLVILMQANPFVPWRGGFGALRAKLEELGRRLPGRVTLVHGDTHTYREDEPLAGLRRIEVWGAPFVSWLPAAAAGGAVRTNAPRYR